MSVIKPEPKAGDPCPTCGGAFLAYRAPTDDERARAADREQPIPFPPFVDTATKDQRAELGALHVCERCGYQTRIAEDATADDPPAKSRTRAGSSKE